MTYPVKRRDDRSKIKFEPFSDDSLRRVKENATGVTNKNEIYLIRTLYRCKRLNFH